METTGEARKNNSNVVPTPAKGKSVKHTDYKGTDENKKDTVTNKVINTDNIEDNNNIGVTPVKPHKLVYDTEFKTVNGTPISITTTSTPSCTNNIYSHSAKQKAKTKKDVDGKSGEKSPHDYAVEDHKKTSAVNKSKRDNNDSRKVKKVL